MKWMKEFEDENEFVEMRREKNPQMEEIEGFMAEDTTEPICVDENHAT